MIKVLSDRCVNCNMCKEKCPFGAIETINNKIYINSNCKECLMCVKSCPNNAITYDKIEKKITNLIEYKNVCIFGQSMDKKLEEITYELLTKGRELANQLDTKLILVVIGKIKEEDIEKSKEYGVDKIIKYTYSGQYDCMIYAQFLLDFVHKYKPDIFLFPATDIGRELAPFLASKCNTGITADCTKLDIDKDTNLLKQTRPTFGGKMLATIKIPDNKPQMCTVRQGIFLAEKVKKNEVVDIIEEKIKIEQEKNKIIIDNIRKQNKEMNLKDAEIIIAGGMGLGKKEGFELLRKLAYILKGQIATTRACVEAGWIDKKYQIGQTGISVKPKIYIACGISGAIQHTAGIKNSNYIIAINKDVNAPIFKIADYGIVGDLYKEIPKIIKKLGG